MVAILKRGSAPNGARALGLAFAMAAAACGGRSVSPAGEGESSGGGGGSLDASGGAVATGGIDAGSIGGSSGDVDSGSSGGAVSGGTGGAAGTGFDPLCRGTRPGDSCPEGHVCGPLVCGLADSGTRTCTCANGLWGCTECDFSNSPFRERPAYIPACSLKIADEVPCSELGVICGPTQDGDYCACWDSPDDGPSWDCDDPPPTWRL